MILSATRLRCLTVASAASAVWGGLTAALLPSVWRPLTTVDQAVVAVSSLALVAALGWGWVAILAGVVEAWRGAPRSTATGVRRWVLAACGVALGGALAAPAQAAEHHPAPKPGSSLSGLPMPERAVGPAHPGAAEVSTVRVRAGDTLWSLAAHDLSPHAGPQEVAVRWRAIYRLNRGVIGPDPDLIRPGQRLRLP